MKIAPSARLQIQEKHELSFTKVYLRLKYEKSRIHTSAFNTP